MFGETPPTPVNKAMVKRLGKRVNKFENFMDVE
jgi:hypothetical protein